MTARARLGALPALEMKGLHPGQQFLAIAELRAGQLVAIARILRLLLGQHAALPRTDAGARPLRAPGQGDLRLLGQGTEAHVRDQQRHPEHQRLLRLRPHHQLGGDRHVLHQGPGRQLRHHELQLVPMGQFTARHAHGHHGPVMAELRQALSGQLVDELEGGLLRRRPGCRRAIVLSIGTRTLLTHVLSGELLVGAIAEGKIAAVLAQAQPGLAALLRGEGLGTETSAHMGAVARGLFLRAAADAEVVFLALGEGYFGGFVVGDDGVFHVRVWL